MAQEDYLNSFWESISPFLDLWQSLRIVTFASRREGRWLNLATRMTFSERPALEPYCFIPIDQFGLFCSSAELPQAREFLREIVRSGVIHLPEGEPVLLSGTESRPDWRFSWSRPRLAGREEALRCVGNTKCTWVLWGNGPYTWDHMDRDNYDLLESAIQFDGSFADLGDLVSRYVPGRGTDPGGSTWAEVLAPLPITLTYDNSDALRLKLYVEAPAIAFDHELKLVMFADPGKRRGEAKPTVKDLEVVSVGVKRWREEVAWLPGSNKATVHLFYLRKKVWQESISRWPAASNLAGAVDDFFDSGGVKLNQWLLPKKKEGDPQTKFELAVVRLLVRKGLNATWYGGKAYGDMPDLAAIAETVSPPAVVVGECTVKKPAEKLSGLTDLCHRLRTALGTDVQVLPAVFTQATLAESEMKQAVERKIALLGRSELRAFAEGINTPDAAVNYLIGLADRLVF